MVANTLSEYLVANTQWWVFATVENTQCVFATVGNTR